MNNGFCLMYRFGSGLDLNKFMSEFETLAILINPINEKGDLLQQFDVNSRTFRKVDLKAVEEQFNSTGSCSFLLWSGENNINVSISSPREGVMLEYYDIDALDLQAKQSFIERLIIRFANYTALDRIALVGSFRGDVDEDDWDSLMLDEFEEPEEEPDVIVINKGDEHKILSVIENASATELDGVVRLKI